MQVFRWKLDCEIDSVCKKIDIISLFYALTDFRFKSFPQTVQEYPRLYQHGQGHKERHLNSPF